MDVYLKTAYSIATAVTSNYSTSFYSASRLFNKEMREAIFSIYGFVRFADEIVDTFHDYPQAELLNQFEQDYYKALELGTSMNPIVHAFQITVKKYGIPNSYIQAFLKSMRDDLTKKSYHTQAEMDRYVYGSADVIGLMCLKVFCYQDEEAYKSLEKFAAKLGSAFQKVNFLRDLQNDVDRLDRRYFPCLVEGEFSEKTKKRIVLQIESDFDSAYIGIKRLPRRSKLPVYIAYCYYKALLRKIKRTAASEMAQRRIRISNGTKCLIMLHASISCKLNIV